MKALNLIICLLAVTLFVACSKKKDGNSNPYQGTNNYGYTPNDPRYNMYGNNNMTGYYIGSQANCQGPSQMFNSLPQYCGWLATEGERSCNPVMVKQAYMQYCQSFYGNTQYSWSNYCAPMIRTGCFYTTGCSYGGKTYKYSSTYVSTGRYSDKDRKSSKKPAPVIPPVTVYPPETKPQPEPQPEPTPAPICNEKPDDCYQEKEGKPETKRCRHPLETSNDKRKYTLLYSRYLKLLNETCGQQTVVAKPEPVQSAPVYQPAPISQAPVAQQPVVQEETVCRDLPHNPGVDCRLKRGERASVVRGTDKKALRAFDFEKGSDGRTSFDKENARGNIECKIPGSVKSTKNYIYSSYEQYVASLKKCETTSVPVAQAPAIEQQEQSQPISMENPVKTEELAPEKAFLGQCMNLQELHNMILDPNNQLASYSAYNVNKPISTARSQEFLREYQNNVGNVLIQSRMSVTGSTLSMSAIGLDVKQSGDRLQVDNTRGAGEIIDCRNGNSMTVRYSSTFGDEIVSYAWNREKGEGLEIVETIQGKFSFRNESSDYKVVRLIGVAKNMNAKQIQNEVTQDMKKKGLLGASNNAGNKFDILNKSR